MSSVGHFMISTTPGRVGIIICNKFGRVISWHIVEAAPKDGLKSAEQTLSYPHLQKLYSTMERPISYPLRKYPHGPKFQILLMFVCQSYY